MTSLCVTSSFVFHYPARKGKAVLDHDGFRSGNFSRKGPSSHSKRRAMLFLITTALDLAISAGQRPSWSLGCAFDFDIYLFFTVSDPEVLAGQRSSLHPTLEAKLFLTMTASVPAISVRYRRDPDPHEGQGCS